MSSTVAGRAADPDWREDGAEAYDRIFVSYSHEDAAIVDRLGEAYRVLGHDYLRDIHSLRSGEDWNEALEKLIDAAEIFQLCWSEAASRSRYVAREWRYALDLEKERKHFIRPVYWERPLPTVPDDLSHLHFAFYPGAAGGEDTDAASI